MATRSTARHGSVRATFASAFATLVLISGLVVTGVAAKPASASVTPSWAQVLPVASPSARHGAAMAYDSARGVTLLFGGSTSGDGSVVNDTWEWDGTTWTELHPVVSPTPRIYSAMAFDPVRQRMVLFGGGYPTFLNDTWEWDGTTWVQRSPSVSPARRSLHTLVWDSVRQRVVLFGGGLSIGGDANDLWEWDGTNWVQRSSSTPRPPTRFGHAATFDSLRGRMVVFGGFKSNLGFLNDTWEWDGNAWSQRVSAQVPLSRSYTSMVFDSVRGVSVLFGGDRDDLDYLGDTWEWDGSAWTQRVLSPSPGSRRFNGLAFDSGRGATVLFGGQAGGRSGTNWGLSDTWELRAIPVPDAPTGVSAIAAPGSALVTWTAPSDNGSAILSYSVTASPGGATVAVPATQTSTTFNGLTNGVGYTFTVTATNAGGASNPSTSSNEVTPADVPDPPGGVSATGGDAQAIVSWSAPSGNGSPITSYSVTASPGGASVTVDGSQLSATVGGLTDGESYTFTVTAANGVGTSNPSLPSNAVTPLGPPSAPSSPSAAAADSQATVSWAGSAANGRPILFYTVTASPGGASALVAGNVLSATVGGLSNGTSYTFTVTATNVVGTGPPSLPSNQVTPSPTIAIGDVSMLEGNSGAHRMVIPVMLSRTSATTLTVQYKLQGSSATGAKRRLPGADFNDRGGAVRTLRFRVNATVHATPLVQYIFVTVYGDTQAEPDETFTVTLSNPTGGYALARPQAIGTILNDD